MNPNIAHELLRTYGKALTELDTSHADAQAHADLHKWFDDKARGYYHLLQAINLDSSNRGYDLLCKNCGKPWGKHWGEHCVAGDTVHGTRFEAVNAETP